MSANLLAIAWVIALGLFLVLGVIYLRMSMASVDLPRGYAVAVIVIFELLILLRAPEQLLFDRVWAETGTLYFGYAYKYGLLSGFFHPVANYFDLSASLASVVAVLLGLRYWPFVDAIFGYFPMLALPFVLAGLGFSPRHRIGLLLILAAVIYSIQGSEVFGTVLHNKAWGAIYSFIVVLSLALQQPMKPLHKVLLVMLPLTGPQAAMFLMIFGGLSLVFRAPRDCAWLLWVIPGLLLQIGCAFVPHQAAAASSVRSISPLSLFLGADLFVTGFAALLFNNILLTVRSPVLWQIVLSNVAMLVFFGGVAFASRQNLRERGLLLLGPIVVLHFLATVLLALHGAESLYRGMGMRYYFPAICMFGMWLVVLDLKGGLVRDLTFLGVLAGIVLFGDRDLGIFYSNNSPPWAEQVAAQEGKSKIIRIYPAGWSIRLPNCGEHYCSR